MRLLVLGGTQFVGHAIVADALARGWDVTVANRGLSGPAPAGARAVTLDRTQPGAFDDLAAERFDEAIDMIRGRLTKAAADDHAIAVAEPTAIIMFDTQKILVRPSGTEGRAQWATA